MLKSKKVCICVPCYNNEKTIYQTLVSIVNQSYKNIDIKVFDNNSTDNTLAIVEEFISKGYNITIYTSLVSSSGEENFNRCIEYADGDYTAIFHSDDVYEKNIIEEQVDFLSTTNCVAVSTHSLLINEYSRKIGERFIPVELKNRDEATLSHKELILLLFKYGNFITCPSVLFSTDILKNHIISFRGDLFKSSSDLDVWIRISEVGKFGFINNPLINYRISEASFSYNLSKKRINDHDLFLVLDYFLSSHKIDNFEVLNNYRNFLLMKDRIKTNVTRICFNNYDLQDISLIANLKFVFHSRFHMKYILYATCYKLFICFPFKHYILSFFKRFK